MANSRAFTVAAPLVNDASGTQTPGTIIKSSPGCKRVLVRNNSFAAVVYIAYEASGLQKFPPAATDIYELPPGASDVFVVMQGQGLFAASGGANARVSCAISDAFPVDVSVDDRKA